MKSILVTIGIIAILAVGGVVSADGYNTVSNKTERVTTTNTFVTEILDVHNKYRAEVGSKPLKWSTSLAAGSKQWADHLASINHLVHSPKPRSPNYGENLHSNTAGWKNYTQMMDGWYAEKQYFKDGVYPDVTTDITKTVGHYTQMVASNTTEVGCGLNTSNTYNNDFLVCRYYPQGNVQGKSTLYPRQSYSHDILL